MKIIRFFFSNKQTKDITKFAIRTNKYDNYKKIIPYSNFNGTFLESYPMQASFTVPKSKTEDAIYLLKNYGYSEV